MKASVIASRLLSIAVNVAVHDVKDTKGIESTEAVRISHSFAEQTVFLAATSNVSEITPCELKLSDASYRAASRTECLVATTARIL